MLRPTETGVNRSSGQPDVPSEQENGEVLNFAARGARSEERMLGAFS